MVAALVVVAAATAAADVSVCDRGNGKCYCKAGDSRCQLIREFFEQGMTGCTRFTSSVDCETNQYGYKSCEW